ncbi:DNA-binding HxlR family transcriptional regulator [Dyella sp. SG562]|uniref:winged helix-turn-helix transcriptional regulator n=1 Tax=unclassified Dyella TaxID=2634549 RepID=UPI00141FCAA5|nr:MULTISPECIES: helix-turn-helix domain-containing protein [unclassified Dyella]NII72197.1 DNA-binding HxlR family transcriptional regulator [Dyella sp. SG562]NKJ22601.1 DNA-binding HxlR family transcriptional regulator [Dyella sp. SG609]
MATDPLNICAAEVVLRVLRGRWAMTILMTLAERGPVHFGAMERSIKGVSAKVLSEQLRYLRNAGVVSRSSSAQRREVYYELTPRGQELTLALDAINDLARRWPDL